jgi:hypothetical protein
MFQQIPGLPLLLTAKEAAENLKISPQTFRKLPIRHFRIGHSHRWALEDIRAYVERTNRPSDANAGKTQVGPVKPSG